MPAVFVHGNPETAAIWQPLFQELINRGYPSSELIALSPPGFGAPVPPGWSATRQAYVDWLSAELASIPGPIDLVGHDWGGGHVLGLLLEQPQAVRSWCVDLIGILHPDYEWHETAQIWQTPGAGEENIAGMVQASDEELTMLFSSLGMPDDVAAAVAAGVDQTMGDCVLELYRDAAQPTLRRLGEDVERLGARPGLALNAENDTYVGTDAMAAETAARAGAQTVHLAGVGHWWMCENPTLGAEILENFWAGLADGA